MVRIIEQLPDWIIALIVAVIVGLIIVGPRAISLFTSIIEAIESLLGSLSPL